LGVVHLRNYLFTCRQIRKITLACRTSHFGVEAPVPFMPYKKELGLTFIEVLIVVIVLGILAGLTLPQFNRAKERTLAREAKANLRRIAEAQKNYALEDKSDDYYPSSGTETNITVINNDLGLMLRSDSQRDWNYAVSNTTATATRTSGSYTTCVYSISYTAENPTYDPSICP
jgi:type II secretory pathway pseudopilin PulG